MKPAPDLLKIITVRIEKTLWLFGARAFLVILILILADLIFGGFVYYKYVYLAKAEEPKATETIIRFDTKTYQQVVGELQARGQVGQELPASESSSSVE